MPSISALSPVPSLQLADGQLLLKLAEDDLWRAGGEGTVHGGGHVRRDLVQELLRERPI